VDIPVVIADVEARWRPLSEREQGNAYAYLDDLWADAQRRVPDLTTRLDDDADGLLAQTVRKVFSFAVIRTMRNPDGKRQESIDDYSFTRDNGTSTGRLELTVDEIAELSGLSSVGASDSFSARAYGEPDCAGWYASPWWYVSP
jgi:hypothetical protein